MELLQNPNIVYLLLVGGLALGVLALAAPGTGLLELGGISLLLIAGIVIAVFHLSVNLWALGVLIIGAALFSLSVRRPRQLTLLVLSIAALVLGSAYLFAGDEWWMPGVNLLLAFVVSLALGGFFWLAARKVLEAELVRPRHDLGGLIGAVGDARTTIAGEGSVYLESELWTARSDRPIPAGTAVRVTGRDGFVLLVEPVEPRLESAPENPE